MTAFGLSNGGRKGSSDELVGAAFLSTDLVKEHPSLLAAKSAGEYLAVVRQVSLGYLVTREGVDDIHPPELHRSSLFSSLAVRELLATGTRFNESLTLECALA